MTEKKEPKHCDLKNYPNLKKFDEYYKDEKNIKKLNIFYKKPNIDAEKYQIDFDTFDKKYDLKKYAEKNNDTSEMQKPINNQNLNVTKKYDFSKISTEDLNYYLLLVNHYYEKVYGGNIFIKGVNGPIEKALDLLKSCQYNTRLALAKILYPVMDRMGGLEEFQNPSVIPKGRDSSSIKNLEIEKNINFQNSKIVKNNNNNELVIQQKKSIKNSPLIYLTFALNDLIGADKTQKENWLQYIIQQVNNKIDYKNLKILMEIACKMRLDLPEEINKEIKNSETLSKKIKNDLESKECDLDGLKNLYSIAQTQKVQTDEFHNLKKIIEQGEAWEKNVKNIFNKIVEFKELESIYNESKILPFELDQELYDELTNRYNKALDWISKFNTLHKITKNKNSNNKYGEHKIESLDVLHDMIKIASDDIKFTSNEVKLLIKNYNFLKETEKEINDATDNNTKKLSKDMLKNFINKLNESKFIIELHDKLEEELNILEWRENLFEYINDSDNSNTMQIEVPKNISEENILEIFSSDKKVVLKNKAFKFLIKEAESKKLLSFPDVKLFLDNEKQIVSWIEKIKPIFYPEKENSKEKEKDNNNIVITFSDFLLIYEEGLKYNIINEEFEEILKKCKELKDLYEEIKKILNNDIKNNLLDFAKLKSFEEKIISYNNITCEEFDLVSNQLSQGKKWLENAKKFVEECNKANKNKFNFLYLNNIDTIDSEMLINYRNENIKIIEKYIKENKIFYKDLKNLTENTPPYFKNSTESTELINYQFLAELKMNNPIKTNNTEDILKFIEDFQGCCVSKDTIINYFNFYRIKTWNQAVKIKLELFQAESLLKESEILKNIDLNEIITEKIDENDIKILSNKIKIMKDWINKTKNFLIKKEKTIVELINYTNEAKELPLISGTIGELIEFKNMIEKNINEIKELKIVKKDFNTICQLYKNFNNQKFIDCPEQLYIKSLYEFGVKWTEDAKKIINSRQLCQLYFRNKVPREDGTIIENSQNLIDVLSQQNNENTLIKPKFVGDESSFLNNNNFLSKKRIFDNNNVINNKDEGKNKDNKEFNSKIKEINTNNNNNMNIDEEIEDKDSIENEINDNSINKDINSNKTEKNNIFDLLESDIEYKPSEKVKKYYINQPIQKYEATNLLSLINNKYILAQSEQNSKLNRFTRSHNTMNSDIKNNDNNKNQQNINQLKKEENVSPEQIQKFMAMDYYHRYMFLRSSLIFIDDNEKQQYCICRKGDDSVNYMIHCEKCKEWFHGKCLGMPKPLADNISNYYCLCCTRKYDYPRENYHKQFFEIKRVSLNDLVLMIEEGKKANCLFEELEILEDIKIRSEIWTKKYHKLLDKIVEIYKKNNFLDKETENQLEKLYLESEAIQVSLSSFLHVINILKHNEWFKGVNKEISANRINEERIKSYIKSAYWIFNIYEKNYDIPKIGDNYCEIVYQLAELKLGILYEMYEIYRQNGGEDNSSSIKDKNKKKF